LRDGAVLVRGIEDILEELDGVAAAVAPLKLAAPPDLDDTQRRIWDFLKDRPRNIDQLAQGLALPVAHLSGVLLTLEIKKVIRRLPGNVFERR
jgi:DNA processing protein